MNVPRRVLPDAANRRGWCPSLARPMPTGDGLLARIHPPLGILTRAQIRAVAAASRAFGNGHVDVTARANLQLRGVTEATRPALVAALGGAGLGDMRADGGPQRLTLTSPLAGLTGEAVDVRAMASAIEAHGLAIAGLPPKTLVLIEGGGTDLSGIAADIHVRATGPGIAAVGLADEAGVTWIATCDEARTAEAVAGLLRAFATSGRRRIRDLADTERGSLVRVLPAILADEPPPPSVGES
ncbi:precorrin-3B synthase, partial [Methylobacterium sp. WL119]